jgi:hypothetical protein
VIQSAYTIQIGNTGGCNVVLGDVLITLYGRIGFKAGNNDLNLGAAAVVDIQPGGQFGFGSGPDFQGNAATQVSIGSTVYQGGFLAFGPDQISATSGGFQSSYLWTGGTSTAWNVSGNWQTAQGNPGAPTASSNVVIPTTPSGGRWPSVTAAYATKRLSVHPSAQLTITATGSLTVNDSLHNWGLFTVNSGGALVQTVASKSCDNCTGGTFQIERQTGTVSPWFVGSPIVGLNKSGYSLCGNAQYIPSTCTAPTLGSTAPCVMVLNEDATTTALNCSHSLWFMESTGTFVSGEGYNLYGTPGVMAFSGADVNNGPVSYGPLGYSSKGLVNLPTGFGTTTTRGWHMVSNPFPSPIQLTGAQLNAMGLEAQIQLWSSAGGGWISLNPLTTATIAVGQGFQVRVAGGVGNFATFAVDNSHRVATTGVPFYKTESLPQTQYVNMTLSNGNSTQDNTAMVYFQDGATPAFDAAYDANRLYGVDNIPYLYTTEQNGEHLSYNALPLLAAGTSQTVPVGVLSGGVSAMTLTFDGIATVPGTVLLEDLKTGAMYPVSEGYVHSFTVQPGDAQNRFMLHFNAAGANGIADLNYSNVSVYPNPTSGKATIMLPANHGFNEVVIYDLEGKAMISDRIAKDETSKSVDISALAAGVYTVKLKGATSLNQKLIKK